MVKNNGGPISREQKHPIKNRKMVAYDWGNRQDNWNRPGYIWYIPETIKMKHNSVKVWFRWFSFAHIWCDEMSFRLPFFLTLCRILAFKNPSWYFSRVPFFWTFGQQVRELQVAPASSLRPLVLCVFQHGGGMFWVLFWGCEWISRTWWFVGLRCFFLSDETVSLCHRIQSCSFFVNRCVLFPLNLYLMHLVGKCILHDEFFGAVFSFEHVGVLEATYWN